MQIKTLLTSAAFARESCPEAHAAARSFRSDLRRISAAIERRNEGLRHPYTALDPHNIARSTTV